MTTYKGILTNNGKALLASATITNPVNYSHLAVGDGNGSTPTPLETRAALVNEKARIALNVVEINPNQTNQIICEAIIPTNIGGFHIREFGLFAGSVMIVNGNYPLTYKPAVNEGGAREIAIKVIINVQNAEVIALYLDDSLIYATREWVKNNYIPRADIIDNLTTNDATKPVSAKQAKLLQDSKAGKTTQIIAGTGLSGGGDLSANLTLSVNYGTAAGTAAEGNDSRLSNSREWTAETVSQAEAETGTATTRRAWTAQRVRQAATAMFNAATTTFTRTLLGRTTAAQVRSDLELGTAATASIGNTIGDVVPSSPEKIADFNALIEKTAGFFQMSGASAINFPTSEKNMGYASIIQGSRSNPAGFAIFANEDISPHIVAYALVKSGSNIILKESKLYTSVNTTIDTNGFLRASGTQNAVPENRTITAGTGLSGGGSLAANRTLSVVYGSASGTAAEGNDSRLSDSREWTAATVSQAEAEAGTATTRRAWTAQRVRQAATAMFNAATTTFTRTLLGRSTAAQVRSDLELGTAAIADATASVSDATAGRLLQVGSGGWLSRSERSDRRLGNYNHIFSIGDTVFNAGNGVTWSTILTLKHDGNNSDSTFIAQSIVDGSLTVGGIRSNTPLPQRRIIDSLNLAQSTGADETYAMSQKAVTDALNTKPDSSVQIIASTGLSGGGNLSANRTLSVNYGTTAGTAAQGNDTRINNGQAAYGWGNHANAGYALKTYTDTELDKKLNANANAVSASKLATARNIALSGAVAGSASFDGSGNINITTTLQQSLGVGQTWQDMKSSRSFNTTYTNSSGKPIMIAVTSLGGSSGFNAFINGKEIIKNYSNYNTAGPEHGITIIVPNGASYMFGGSGGLSLWWELR